MLRKKHILLTGLSTCYHRMCGDAGLWLVNRITSLHHTDWVTSHGDAAPPPSAVTTSQRQAVPFKLSLSGNCTHGYCRYFINYSYNETKIKTTEWPTERRTDSASFTATVATEALHSATHQLDADWPARCAWRHAFGSGSSGRREAGSRRAETARGVGCWEVLWRTLYRAPNVSNGRLCRQSPLRKRRSVGIVCQRTQLFQVRARVSLYLIAPASLMVMYLLNAQFSHIPGVFNGN